MTDTAVVGGCPKCGQSCSEDDLNQCLGCDEQYCYKCDGDCSCVDLARAVMTLTQEMEDRGILPFLYEVQAIRNAGEGRRPLLH